MKKLEYPSGTEQARLVLAIIIAALVLFGNVAFQSYLGKKEIAARYERMMHRATVGNARIALGTIATAQELHHKYWGAYGTFDQLAEATLLGGRFIGESPVVEGYRYRLELAPESEGRKATYRVNADPHPDGNEAADGRPFLFIDESKEVHVNEQRPATSSDPIYSKTPSDESF
jgi:hypothetical protein